MCAALTMHVIVGGIRLLLLPPVAVDTASVRVGAMGPRHEHRVPKEVPDSAKVTTKAVALRTSTLALQGRIGAPRDLYGTEGQRFESSRARFAGPVASAHGSTPDRAERDAQPRRGRQAVARARRRAGPPQRDRVRPRGLPLPVEGARRGAREGGAGGRR